MGTYEYTLIITVYGNVEADSYGKAAKQSIAAADKLQERIRETFPNMKVEIDLVSEKKL